MSRSSHRAAIFLWGAVLMGCGADAAPFAVRPPPPFPSNPPPTRDELARIREDFNNRDLIASLNGDIIVDTNRGIATLTAQMFPDFSGDGAVSAYDRHINQNGLIEASTIIVHEGGTLEASDSVELRAEDRVIVAGSVVVGRGGITIIARERIQIDGSITSEGPVRLLLGDDTGTIQISGVVSAGNDIQIYGRGALIVDGIISTTTLPDAEPAAIDVYSYGDVTITAVTAKLFTTGQMLGGKISLESESNLLLDDGAEVGVPPDPLRPDGFQVGGDIELRGANITIGRDVVVAATGTNERDGGKVHATATGRVATGDRALIAAGNGPDGGNVTFKARAIELGEATRIVGGSGSTQPGVVTIQAVDSIGIKPYATIEGGAGQCVRGGDIFLEVGGLISAEPNARIIGGTAINATCGGIYPGGAITVFAEDAVGVLEAVVRGQGGEEGALNYNIVESYTVTPPNLDSSISGQVESTTIDRGEEASYTVPRLVEIDAEVPADSTVTVLLAGADDPSGPFDVWLPIGFDPNDKEFEVFVGRRFVRYRVMLEGRRFDVPVLEYFEVDLAPVGY